MTAEQSTRARWLGSRVGLVLMAAVLAATVSWMMIGGAGVAHADAPQALILGDSVSSGVAPDGSGVSLEQYEAQLNGFAVTVVTGAQWDAMSASDFAKYQVLVIGDPTCGGTPSFDAAATNASTWEPVVMGSGGNKVLIGTDPTYHYRNGSAPNAGTLEGHGIAFAGALAGATGAYVDLTCAYDSSPVNTPVPLLDGLSTHGAGQFTVVGESTESACATSVNVVAQSGPTSGLTDADLSGWNCSVHEAFQTFPSDYTPLAVAPATSGFPTSYCANDVSTSVLACGSPYILVSGGGVVVTSEVDLTPPSQTLNTGSAASLVANVGGSSAPVAGGTVVFSVDGGPDVGQTFTGTTNASGNTTFTFTNNGKTGTDNISATYTDSHGVSQKATATVTWATATTTTTTTVTPQAPPALPTVKPVLSGTTSVGKTLTCSTGTVTGNPTSFTYRWYRTGALVSGATGSTYTLVGADQGTIFTCQVTASNAVGSGTGTSNALYIPLPRVPGCPAATGRMDGHSIGKVSLGMTRDRIRKLFSRHDSRGRSFEDFFCLKPIGTRVGYATPLLLKTLSKQAQKSLKGKVVWASTSNPFYSLDGVRPGESLKAASKKLGGTEKAFHIGHNYWYLARKGSFTAVLKVRHGEVQEVGIANNALTATRQTQSVLMHSFF